MNELARGGGYTLEEYYPLIYLGTAIIVIPPLIIGTIILFYIWHREKKDKERIKQIEHSAKIDEVIPEFSGIRPRGYSSDTVEGARYGGIAFIFAVLSLFFFPLIFLALTVIFAVIAMIKGSAKIGVLAIFFAGLFFSLQVILAL